MVPNLNCIGMDLHEYIGLSAVIPFRRPPGGYRLDSYRRTVSPDYSGMYYDERKVEERPGLPEDEGYRRGRRGAAPHFSAMATAIRRAGGIKLTTIRDVNPDNYLGVAAQRELDRRSLSRAKFAIGKRRRDFDYFNYRKRRRLNASQWDRPSHENWKYLLQPYTEPIGPGKWPSTRNLFDRQIGKKRKGAPGPFAHPKKRKRGGGNIIGGPTASGHHLGYSAWQELGGPQDAQDHYLQGWQIGYGVNEAPGVFGRHVISKGGLRGPDLVDVKLKKGQKFLFG